MSDIGPYTKRKNSLMKLMYIQRRRITRENRDWLHPLEDVGFARGEGEGVKLYGLDGLINETVYLITYAGQAPEKANNNARNRIEEILAEDDVNDLLSQLSKDEARELRIDLEILGFIPPDITKPQFAR